MYSNVQRKSEEVKTFSKDLLLAETVSERLPSPVIVRSIITFVLIVPESLSFFASTYP